MATETEAKPMNYPGILLEDRDGTRRFATKATTTIVFEDKDGATLTQAFTTDLKCVASAGRAQTFDGTSYNPGAFMPRWDTLAAVTGSIGAQADGEEQFDTAWDSPQGACEIEPGR
jgi:hypothetical protein